jgi:hypothetical protein
MLGAVVIGGCSGGSEASVSSKEEEMFKHPAKVDLSKIPPIDFKRKGPSFIGKPTGATGRPNSAPPPEATSPKG